MLYKLTDAFKSGEVKCLSMENFQMLHVEVLHAIENYTYTQKMRILSECEENCHVVATVDEISRTITARSKVHTWIGNQILMFQ